MTMMMKSQQGAKMGTNMLKRTMTESGPWTDMIQIVHPAKRISLQEDDLFVPVPGGHGVGHPSFAALLQPANDLGIRWLLFLPKTV